MEELTGDDKHSWVWGDKGYRSENLFAELWNKRRLFLHNSYRRIEAKPNIPPKQVVKKLTGIRRLVETAAGQLEQQFPIKKVWARDRWHFVCRRLPLSPNT